MSNLLQRVRSLFQPAAETPLAPPVVGRPAANGAASNPLRNSNGLREFLASWNSAESLRVLDLGCTSQANLTFFTERGHGVHTTDVLLDAADPRYLAQSEEGPVFQPDLWLDENLNLAPASFDAALLWDLMDYIPEPLVKPLVARISRLLKPGGAALAYFHTKDAGPDALFYRYHIHNEQTLLLRPGAHYRLQRIFNNRHVENLFQGYSLKFFLARDNLREVLAVR